MKKDWFQEEYGISVWTLGQAACGALVYLHAVLLVYFCLTFHALLPRVVFSAMSLAGAVYWFSCGLAFRRGGRAER